MVVIRQRGCVGGEMLGGGVFTFLFLENILAEGF